MFLKRGSLLEGLIKYCPEKRRGPREGISTGPQGGSSGAFYVWGSGTDCFWGKQLQIWEGTTFAVWKYTTFCALAQEENAYNTFKWQKKSG